MAEDRAVETDSNWADALLSRKVVVTLAVIYPLWHLAAPSDALDPWPVWWGIAASFLVVDQASRRIPFIKHHVVSLLRLCAWSCTLQLYVLAFLNGMNPFYVVGSAISVLVVAASSRTKADHLAYGFFVFVLSAVLFALDPEARNAVYWGGMLSIIAGSYYRLSVQLTAAQLAREHRARLEEQVRERTSELSDANRRLRREIEARARVEDELRVSQKLEAVGRLAGGLAHEFNNLLTRIRLYAELALEKAPANADVREDVAEIQKAGREATALTRQLLTFSRGGETRTDLLDVNGAVEESSMMLRHLLGEDIDLTCILGDGPHRVRADRRQFEQVLVNLVLNARDAMREGGRLTIETSLVSPHGPGGQSLPETLREHEYVRIALSDTGVGMDSETRARAFDPFFTRKPVSHGTGLGLSIVYGILNRAKGHVRVLSEPGKGACFELFWPLASELPVLGHEPTSTRLSRGGGERVLLVEDEPDLRLALKRLLEGSGYSVLDAGDPREALQIAEADPGPIELLLTDVVMPVMSGVDLADAICRVRPETRVLLMSGHMVLDGEVDRALPPGVAFLAKPFESKQLSAKVRAVLDSFLPPGAAPARSEPPAS